MGQGQESLKRAAQLIGWHHERHGGKRIAFFYLLKILNQRRFEGGMERSSNETKHEDRASLLLKWESED